MKFPKQLANEEILTILQRLPVGLGRTNIPSAVFFHPKLNLTSLKLLTIIIYTSYAWKPDEKDRRTCRLNNKEFKYMLNLGDKSTSQITGSINLLQKLGIIKCTYDERNDRTIHVLFDCGLSNEGQVSEVVEVLETEKVFITNVTGQVEKEAGGIGRTVLEGYYEPYYTPEKIKNIEPGEETKESDGRTEPQKTHIIRKDNKNKIINNFIDGNSENSLNPSSSKTTVSQDIRSQVPPPKKKPVARQSRWMEYWNAFPEVNKHKNCSTKIYRETAHMLLQIKSGRFRFTLNKEFMKKHRIPDYWNGAPRPLDDATMEKTLKALALMYLPDHWPYDKSWIRKMSLASLLYNQRKNNSWFLAVLYNPPRAGTEDQKQDLSKRLDEFMLARANIIQKQWETEIIQRPMQEDERNRLIFLVHKFKKWYEGLPQNAKNSFTDDFNIAPPVGTFIRVAEATAENILAKYADWVFMTQSPDWLQRISLSWINPELGTLRAWLSCPDLEWRRLHRYLPREKPYSN